ncbi:DUF2059 domain-containing protein [Sinorhizobium meliloti]|uniref:DUF2059 domain-containing protein n=1 Tax=Rhizobium meliloti TaxID=382 RepID=UPI00129710F2|nr:DUF2059 domain-containing protein [Sinorhizobium meliloti]MDW9594625.1 DUF2059 domain-containing protein [Sinorhizobium meliloti]MDX0190610.1 DUF2059 domain-containing protein [Sinorhizobium meliloti]MQV07683.1 DUF2059 domain-containing protein [Sinorhizobium meliloti]MQV10059.1 DUF2059 domain-containing protein [Sinorhizobium meliloti]MQV61720.1 DUF2059 domain-containing protein [Sinorhizobium meliloti]
MNKFAGLARTFATAAILVSVSVPAVRAQEVTEDQIKAARATIAALGVTNSFDNILPNLAERLKNTLIQASPNHQELITATVDEKALSLAGRRSDLEREAATIYAKTFTVEELNAIADFYNSTAGKKLLNDGPIASREMLKAADIWAAGVSRDLTSEATKSLDEKIGNAPAANAGAAAPAQ